MVKLLKLIISKISTFVKDEWNFYGSFFIAYALSLFLDWNMSKLQRANQFLALLMNIFILLTVIKKIVFPSKKKMKVEKIADMNKQAKNMDLGINPEMKINETVELAEHIMKGGKKIMKKLKDFFMDIKLGADERDYVPVLCVNGIIAAVIPYRVSNEFIVDKNTKNILMINFMRNL